MIQTHSNVCVRQAHRSVQYNMQKGSGVTSRKGLYNLVRERGTVYELKLGFDYKYSKL